MQYYVYELIDPNTNKPFYIGKGSKLRMYYHAKEVQRNRIPNNNKHLFNKINKIFKFGLKIKYKKIYLTENEDDAYQKEMDRINNIGLINLCNIESGGRKNKKMSDETRLKISIANTGKPSCRKGKKLLPEHINNVSKALLGRKLTTLHKENIRKTLMGKK